MLIQSRCCWICAITLPLCFLIDTNLQANPPISHIEPLISSSMPDYHIACNTLGKYEAPVLKLYTVSNLHYQLSSPFFSVISCSLLININLHPPPPPIPSHFPIPKLVEIHKLPISIWYIPSKAILVAAWTSFVE